LGVAVQGRDPPTPEPAGQIFPQASFTRVISPSAAAGRTAVLSRRLHSA